jgi:hypothetical protein
MLMRMLPGSKGLHKLPDISKYLNQVERLFTKSTQSNGNIVVGYEPPREYERLKDIDGKKLRSMAEKSPQLNKFILAKCTQLYCAPTVTHGVRCVNTIYFLTVYPCRLSLEARCWMYSAAPRPWL